MPFVAHVDNSCVASMQMDTRESSVSPVVPAATSRAPNDSRRPWQGPWAWIQNLAISQTISRFRIQTRGKSGSDPARYMRVEVLLSSTRRGYVAHKFGAFIGVSYPDLGILSPESRFGANASTSANVTTWVPTESRPLCPSPTAGNAVHECDQVDS